MAEKKEKRYVSDNAQLMAEWDWDKNIDVSPSDITLGSNKKVWWKHWHNESGQWHFWQANISNRAFRNSGCPYCTQGRPKLLKGFNDFETWCHKNKKDDLLAEWDYYKNQGCPQDYFPTSHKKVWWKCSRGHSWDMTIAHRTSMGCGCPVCANLRVSVGDNDLEIWCYSNHREELLEEWDYANNTYSQ